MSKLDPIQVGFPFQLDDRGRMNSANPAQHLEDLIEQVLLTDPGERVNRPDLGCDLRRALFATLSQEQLSALQALVQGAVQRFLGDRARVERVSITTPGEDRAEVRVRYTDLRQSAARLVTFQFGIPH